MLPLSLLLICIPLARSVTVITQSGPVCGSTINFMGKSVNRYLGIPFVKPPVGDLRFRKPEPVEPWSQTLQAVNFPPSCLQYHPFSYPWMDKMPGQSEDCLYLNIWVPVNCNKQPKAIMFYIFSGGFSYGSNRKPVYDGHVLAAEGDVIVVLVNYRIGMLGFLSTETDDAPGNMGLLDILEALKWINNNIGAFGGDKNRISLFGHSAGAIASGYLLLSPLSKGLFQRAIMESGAPIWMTGDTKKANYELGQKVASAVHCASNSTTLKDRPEEVVGCLRTRDAEILLKIANSPTKSTSFMPIHGDQFMPVDPIIAFKSGDFQDVDILIGVVKDEESVTLTAAFYNVFGPHGERNTQINRTLGRDFILKLFEDYTFKEDVANYYLSNVGEYDYDTVRSQTYQSSSDFRLICPSIYFAEGFEKKRSKAYYYYFYHRSENTVYAPWMGVTHFAEIPFVFGRPLDDPSKYSQEEIQLSKNMIEMWTKFTKTGVPSPNWKEFSRSHSYIQRFYINERGDNYLKHHLVNCDFFRKYFGYA